MLVNVLFSIVHNKTCPLVREIYLMGSYVYNIDRNRSGVMTVWFVPTNSTIEAVFICEKAIPFSVLTG